MESEIKNGDQQTEALEIDFVIDLEMYTNWQKMEISKISIAYYQKKKMFYRDFCFTFVCSIVITIFSPTKNTI